MSQRRNDVANLLRSLNTWYVGLSVRTPSPLAGSQLSWLLFGGGGGAAAAAAAAAAGAGGSVVDADP